MIKRVIKDKSIEKFRKFLLREEKSENTVKKYTHDVAVFAKYCGIRELTKEAVVEYKKNLIEKGYALRSINSMLASLNSFFSFLGLYDLRIKTLKIQNQIFRSEETELTRKEYESLCQSAEGDNNERLCLILQTICGTGIRVSELKFITVEAVKRGEAVVSLKGKTRRIFIVNRLKKKLLCYITEQGIKEGAVFVTRSGNPIDRTSIWREMKSLCNEANLNPKKVFPHNLRHLFAREFYKGEKDIVKLADVLGHSNINTTRIYTASTGAEHRQYMEKLELIP